MLTVYPAESWAPRVRAHECVKMAERIIKILSVSDRPIILVFSSPRSLLKFDGFTPTGRQIQGGGAIFDHYATVSRKR